MPYMGPGPAVIGQAEYDRLVKEHNDTADGRIGSAVLAPMPGMPSYKAGLDHELPADFVHDPEPVAQTFATMNVQTCLRLVKAEVSVDQLLAWLDEEESRENPRPSVLTALRTALG